MGDSKGMKRLSYPSDLSDEQWKRIERLVPAPKLGGRPAKHDRLAILNAILSIIYITMIGLMLRRLAQK